MGATELADQTEATDLSDKQAFDLSRTALYTALLAVRHGRDISSAGADMLEYLGLIEWMATRYRLTPVGWYVLRCLSLGDELSDHMADLAHRQAALKKEETALERQRDNIPDEIEAAWNRRVAVQERQHPFRREPVILV